MRIPKRLLTGPHSRGPLAASGAAWLALILSFPGAPGCNRRANTHIGNLQQLEGGAATLDARGSVVDSEVYLNQRTSQEGASGNGGNVRVSSIGGTVTMVATAQSFDENAMIAALDLTSGIGLTVAAGQVVEVQGGAVLNFLRIDRGGTLVLSDNATATVLGDVLIAGDVRTDVASGVIRQDGHNLTLNVLANALTGAAGSVVITGNIVVSGANANDGPVSNLPGSTTPGETVSVGGNGGELFIACDGVLAITGQILAEGGGNDSQDASRSISGRGGRILLGTDSDVFFSGHMSARAGNSFTNNVTDGPVGGDIQVVALGDILMEEISSINSSGGRNSGLTGGDGGTVSIEAQIGNTTLTGFDINAGGGRLLFLSGGTGGNGGTVSLAGQVLSLTDMAIVATGGDVTEDASGFGGDGGVATLSGSTSVVVAPDVIFDAMGGDARGPLNLGGDGGTFSAIAGGTASTGVDFTGQANVRGGNNFGGQEGPGGTACVTFASDPLSLINIQGINDYPIPSCTASSFNQFEAVVHDLDCVDTTITPDVFSASLPAVLGVEFYRVFASDVTIDVSGETNGDIDLFVGPSGALGSTDPASYTLGSSETPGTSTESLTVAGAPGPFIAVMVLEVGAFVEDYTITVSGCP